MTRMRPTAATVLALTMFGAPVAAQGISFSGHAGTLGAGADVSLGFSRQIAVRAGANLQPWEPTREFDDIEFTLDLASPSFLGVIDWYPGGAVFRLSGGAVAFRSDTELRAKLTRPVDIGNATYTPQQIGTLTGEFAARRVAPYAGLGFGKAPGRRGLGLTLDVGLAFQGAPDVTLTATGPLAADPTFRADLAREEQNIEDDAKPYRFYPVLSLGIVLGF